MEKKVKIGRGWPEPAGIVRNGFRTPPGKRKEKRQKKRRESKG